MARQEKLIYPNSKKSFLLERTFGKGWPSSKEFKTCEEVFLKLLSINQNKIVSIFFNTIKFNEDFKSEADGFCQISGALMVATGIYKDEVDKLNKHKRRRAKKFEGMTAEDIYIRQIKKGNRFAKKIILTDPTKYKESTVKLASTCPEPDDYEFKNKRPIGNLFG